jgi:preprotein translocase subunit SecY
MDWGWLIYLALIIAFTFFYAEMEIDPETLADNFQKNGSYIPGIRPGKETERYVGKVLNRVTFIGAMALGFISPYRSSWSGLNVFDGDNTLAIGGTGLIIIVGVALELNAQIDGLLAGKSFDQVREGI